MRRRQFSKASFAMATATGAVATTAQVAEPASATKGAVALSSWGSFHVGGRLLELSGKQIRKVLFSPSNYARCTTLPSCTFPADRASYLRFTKQNVPRWTTTDDATVAAYIALLEKVGPSMVIVHSQGGLFGWTVAQARPELFKALVLLEPAAMPAPRLEALQSIPQPAVYGDNIAQNTRWPTIRANGIRFAESTRAVGGSVGVVDLPEHGIKGDSHMIMMDRTSDRWPGWSRLGSRPRDSGPDGTGAVHS